MGTEYRQTLCRSTPFYHNKRYGTSTPQCMNFIRLRKSIWNMFLSASKEVGLRNLLPSTTHSRSSSRMMYQLKQQQVQLQRVDSFPLEIVWSSRGTMYIVVTLATTQIFVFRNRMRSFWRLTDRLRTGSNSWNQHLLAFMPPLTAFNRACRGI